jgi:hypothetical protein
VYVGPASDPILCAVTSWTDGFIECDVQAGDGANLVVNLSQESGVLLVVHGLTISYEPPSDVASPG